MKTSAAPSPNPAATTASPSTHSAQIARYSAEFPLTDPVSQDLLAQLASARLRLERAGQLEALAQQSEPTLDQLPQLAALERYRKSAEASYHRAHRMLQQRLETAYDIDIEREKLAREAEQEEEEEEEAARQAKHQRQQPAASLGQTVVYTTPKPGRNEPCPCRSGRKYKVCCLNSKCAAA